MNNLDRLMITIKANQNKVLYYMNLHFAMQYDTQVICIIIIYMSPPFAIDMNKIMFF